MRVPELVAHRGYARHYPENTLPALDGAIRAGARYVEVDVQLTQDFVPVLFHDRALTRLCRAPGAVHEYGFEALQALRASHFERFGYKFAQTRIATLAELRELLRAHPGVTAFVELKRNGLERFGVATVLGRVWLELESVAAQCVPISYSLEALAAARRQWPTIGVVIDHWRERRQEAVRRLRPEYLFCDADGLPRFGKLRFDHSKIAIFEVADAGLALKLAGRGVDFIETFACGELRAELELIAASA